MHLEFNVFIFADMTHTTDRLTVTINDLDLEGGR